MVQTSRWWPILRCQDDTNQLADFLEIWQPALPRQPELVPTLHGREALKTALTTEAAVRQLHCTRSERLSLAATQEPSSNSFSSEKCSWNSTQLCSKRFLRISSKITTSVQSVGFPGGASGKEPASQNRRHKWHEFNPWVGKIPWRRAWQPTPVFLPGESHGQRSLVGYGP